MESVPIDKHRIEGGSVVEWPLLARSGRSPNAAKLLFGALPFCRLGGVRRRGDQMKLDIPFMDKKGPLQLKPPAILAVATLERMFRVGPAEIFRSRRGVGYCPLSGGEEQ